LTPQCAKIPIHFDTDREAIEMAMNSLALTDWANARIVRIQDTLSLAEMQISETLVGPFKEQTQPDSNITLHHMEFDAAGNLMP
jgi:hypothetical protein